MFTIIGAIRCIKRNKIIRRDNNILYNKLIRSQMIPDVFYHDSISAKITEYYRLRSYGNTIYKDVINTKTSVRGIQIKEHLTYKFIGTESVKEEKCFTEKTTVCEPAYVLSKHGMCLISNNIDVIYKELKQEEPDLMYWVLLDTVLFAFTVVNTM